MSVQVVLSNEVKLMMSVEGDAVWLDDTLYADDQISCSVTTVHFRDVATARKIAEDILRLTAPRRNSYHAD